MKKHDFSDRHTYLGASEIGQALNMSEWGTQYELWEQKTLRAPRTPHKDIFDRGHFMEDAVVGILKDRYEIEVYDREKEYTEKDRTWLRSHIDGLIPDTSPYIGLGVEVVQDGPGVLEIKAPGTHAVRKYGTAGLPGDYIMQMHMNMHNAGCTWGMFVVMDYDNWDIIPIYMELDEALVKGCLPFLDKFWACVQQDIAPPRQEEPYRTMGPSESRVCHIKDEGPLAAELIKCHEVAKQADEELEVAKAAVKNAMLTHDTDEAILHMGQQAAVKVTWRESKPSTYVDGTKAVSWTQTLVSAIVSRDEDMVQGMVKVFSPELFEKQRAASRRFTYKIKED